MSIIKIQTSIRIEPTVLAKIRKIAEEDNRSVANMIEYLIMQKIKSYEYENGEIEATEKEIYI
ncbi:MAG: hypothetical protein Q4D26_02655 [Clostridia bacterium]|nr:hypothetical protein [Clostridia bacterium]